ncbi:MAG: metallophosphoesterase, partial [Burkholderiaceae bacterium]
MSILRLVQALPANPLDIVGDIHGELSALSNLLAQLGYDKNGRHRDDRKLVFVGDLCDRGPNSYGAIRLVQHLIEQNNAYSILGNHEINLLTDDVKDGSGWFFDERYENDLRFYAPFQRVLPEQRETVREFLLSLPIALVRADIRIVHAAWTTEAIDAIQNVPVGKVAEQFKLWNDQAQSDAEKSGLYERYIQEKKQWSSQLEDANASPPFLHAIAEYEAAQQMINPLKILTSGVEKEAIIPFFSGNRWRFSDRVNWWD